MNSPEVLLYQEISHVIRNSRQKVFRMANSALLESYWEIGRIIVADEQDGAIRATYGEETLKRLSGQLTMEFGRGFDESNLRNMRSFYNTFPIRDALRHELSWTHYRMLIRVDSSEKRAYYLDESIKSGWNSRELARQLKSLAFERRLTGGESYQSTEETTEILKDPYIFEFLGVNQNEQLFERDLEKAIISNLQHFLLEIGRGFAFVDRQQHVTTDTSDFYVDLVFYNYILKCFVLVDLKTGELTHQDIGQMDMYVRMYDDLKRNEGDNPTIGILLCAEKDETIVKYSVLKESSQLFASKYLLYLPKEEELKAIIEQDRLRFRLDQK